VLLTPTAESCSSLVHKTQKTFCDKCLSGSSKKAEPHKTLQKKKMAMYARVPNTQVTRPIPQRWRLLVPLVTNVRIRMRFHLIRNPLFP